VIGTKYLSAKSCVSCTNKTYRSGLSFVRERVSRKLLEIEHVASGDQIADGLTKPLTVRQMELFKNNLKLDSLD
jgi:hypothetical protein